MVSDDDSLRSLCANKGGICVLGLLDGSVEKHAGIKKASIQAILTSSCSFLSLLPHSLTTAKISFNVLS